MSPLRLDWLVAAWLQGAGALTPAHPSLRARCAPAITDTFELTIVTPGRPDRAVATLVRSRAPARHHGIAVCVVTQRYQRGESADLDSSMVDAVTLAPIRYAAQVGAERQRFEFTPDSAAGVVQRADSAPRPVVHAAPQPFFLAVADLEVVRSLPLTAGYEAQFVTYNPPRGFHVARIRVEALDTIPVAGRPEPAWRLRYDAGAAPTVMWLRLEGHELLRSRSDLPNGAVFWRRRAGDHATDTAQAPAGLAAAALGNQRFSWLTRSVPGFRVYFQAGSYGARHQDSLLARLPSSLAHARTLLDTRAPAGPIDLFFVETRDDMAALVGGPANGFAHQAARAVFLVTNPAWRAFERHEVTHIVAFHAWGAAAANGDWLVEGLAQAADGRCGGYSNETILRRLAGQRGWIPLEDMLFDFRRQPDLRAYLQAAGFVQYLLAAAGPRAVEQLWRQGSRPETPVNGRPLRAHFADWRGRLEREPLVSVPELAGIEDVGCGLGAPPSLPPR